MNAWDKLREKEAGSFNKEAEGSCIAKAKALLEEAGYTVTKSSTKETEKEEAAKKVEKTDEKGKGTDQRGWWGQFRGRAPSPGALGIPQQEGQNGWYVRHPSGAVGFITYQGVDRDNPSKGGTYVLNTPGQKPRPLDPNQVQTYISNYSSEDVGPDQYNERMKDYSTHAQGQKKRYSAMPETFTTADGRTFQRGQYGGYTEKYYDPDKGVQLGNTLLGQQKAWELWQKNKGTGTEGFVNPEDITIEKQRPMLAHKASKRQRNLEQMDDNALTQARNNLNKLKDKSTT